MMPLFPEAVIETLGILQSGWKCQERVAMRVRKAVGILNSTGRKEFSYYP